MQTISEFITLWIKFFFILTPFFVMSYFLVITRNMSSSAKTNLAIRVGAAII